MRGRNGLLALPAFAVRRSGPRPHALDLPGLGRREVQEHHPGVDLAASLGGLAAPADFAPGFEMALVNAIRERVYGFLNLLGMPATGIERERTCMQYALAFPGKDEENALPALARGLIHAPWADEEERLAAEVIQQLVVVESGEVFVTALKPAWRGEGWILRLEAPRAPLPAVRVMWKGMQPRNAWLCDARERDLRQLDLMGQALVVPMESAVVTVRVV